MAIQYTDEQISEIYDDLTHDIPAKGDKNPLPQRWSAAEFTTATNYVKRVAKSHSLDEFTKFMKTGQPVHPVKMTPAEMEVLMGGGVGPFADWVGTIGGVVGLAAAGTCM
jgi:hypothetical protein